MGLLNGLLKAGIAKKVIDEAKKPANQAKAKDLFRQVQAKKQGRGGTGSGPR